MNSDLLTRLQMYADQLGGITGEALDEIKRLNETAMFVRKIESLAEENATLRVQLKQCFRDWHDDDKAGVDKIKKLEAEIERLREICEDGLIATGSLQERLAWRDKVRELLKGGEA